MALDMRTVAAEEDRRIRGRRRATVREPASVVERLLPLNFNAWRETGHEAEVVVTGHNPVLAAILLKQAIDIGFKCLLTVEPGDEEWPYDLAAYPHTATLVSSALGLRATRYGHPERFLPGLVEEFVMPEAGMITVLDRGRCLRALSKQHDGEVSLAVDPRTRTAGRPSSERDLAAGALSRAVAASDRLRVSDKGRTFVFARRAILTGRSDGFAPASSDGTDIVYENRNVFAVGTAARHVSTDQERARMMVDDIVRCARFEF